MALRSVPFTLKQFSFYFRKMFETNEAVADRFLDLFLECFNTKKRKGSI